ncbi:MAG: hypothetical protein D6705_08995 [Deltaproteobacteria bacterium]|nr:MAG: hypothetical protein D6705_08995 [Deltaproteobacteria bacterium]
MKHFLPALLSLGLCLSGGACSFSFHASAGSKSSSRPAGSKTGKPAKPTKKKDPTKKKLHDEGGDAQPEQGGGEGDATPPERQPTGDQGAQGQAKGTTLSARPTPDDPKNPDTVTNRAGSEHPKPAPKDITSRPKPTSPPSGPSKVKAPD